MPADRRRTVRIAYRDGRLPPPARIRPGRAVVLVNLCVGGALVEGPWRFRPGSRVELIVQAAAHDLRMVCARVARCYVARLEPGQPVRYRAALTFEAPLLVPRDDPVGGYRMTELEGASVHLIEPTGGTSRPGPSSGSGPRRAG